MLLLGAVGLFEPVNGYQIRRELMSWQVDRWANVKPGSIYHGLTGLVTSGLATRHDLCDGSREVAVYQLTDDGRAELERLLTEAVTTVNIFDRHDFHAAFGLLPLLDGQQVVALLEERRTGLTAAIAEFPDDATPGDLPYVPPHAVRAMQLWGAEARAELAWLTDVLDDVRAGRLVLGFDDLWSPPPDDPSHQMTADRERYRSLIDEQAARSGATSQ